MESMREKCSLAEHAVEAGTEFNLGDGEGMSEMKDTVHVGEWKVAEPFGELLLDFCF
jgi:hypothetical protein